MELSDYLTQKIDEGINKSKACTKRLEESKEILNNTDLDNAVYKVHIQAHFWW